MEAVYKERLLALADHLENNVTDAAFDMRYWHHRTGCGTVACAMGHACDVPMLRAAGLFLVDECPAMQDEPNECVGIAAAMRLFGLKLREALHLFDPHRYDDVGEPPTKANVVASLRASANRGAAS